MLSLPRSRSLCGRDHRNLASRSTLPPCCKASQTHATCSGEKAREEAALTNSSVRTASALRSMDNSAASSATSLMHSRLPTSFTFSLLMSFAVVTSPAEEEDIFLFKPSLVTSSPCECDRISDSSCKQISLSPFPSNVTFTLLRLELEGDTLGSIGGRATLLAAEGLVREEQAGFRHEYPPCPAMDPWVYLPHRVDTTAVELQMGQIGAWSSEQDRCENCVEMLFARGSGNCVQCETPLRKSNFRVQLFEDPAVDKEVEIRKKVLKIYNKRDFDFPSLREYNDYLEQLEDTEGLVHL
ncbi:CDK-activating kinase assembly factor MAT1 [Liparis tanakae]|uniref:CDK-activating kinase assembly factor MAT1 n=1 Tax=Liparis tanakae TaxID=230148 RepID=A0A4Z2J403_9TELE|nr:CDK-activating kinase assembly factor MAT1 [Liparis tanakae]